MTIRKLYAVATVEVALVVWVAVESTPEAASGAAWLFVTLNVLAFIGVVELRQRLA